MTITPEDKELLAEIDKAIEVEKDLVVAMEPCYRSSYTRDDAMFGNLIALRSLRHELVTNLVQSRITVLRAAARLTQ